MAGRSARRERVTTETEVSLALDLDASGEAEVATGLPFFDHLLLAWAKNARCALRVRAKGDIEVDGHHTVEDVGLVLGAALREALGGREGIRRYGQALLPMDDALVRVALDLSGRPYLQYGVELSPRAWGAFTVDCAEEFWRAFAVQGGVTLHVDLLRARNPHHALEAVWKAVGQACRDAWELDPRLSGPLSTKGVLDV